MRERQRTRMISFRVTAREFDVLKAKSEADGAATLSEFARLALCRGIGVGATPAAGLTDWAEEIQQLRAELHRLSALIDGAPPQQASETPRMAIAGRRGGGAR